ncbi:hypothetical protein [Butyrivibrio sp. XBB1001]|uniref:hypothetical protein n=1 Tax=Butyrivibrio sp. XBB1001 TaxID=1280682 RepID=UPI00041ECDF6|nr:hypothetical protein [Butyrivibrio sp. XBB1001]
MKIHGGIKASSNGARWVLITLYYNMFSYVLIYTFGLPRPLLYIGDLLTIWTFFYAVRIKQRATVPKTFICFFLYLFIGLFSGLLNSESPLLLLWGMRNNLRYILFLYACYVLIRREDLERIFKLLWIVFAVSVPLCTIERFFVDYPAGTIVGDMVGGVFWNYSGCNLPLNVILCICLTQATIGYYKNKVSIFKFLVVCISALYMAATAELKAFILEFAVIIIVAAIFEKIRWNKVIVLVLGAFAFSYIVSLFVLLNDKPSMDYYAVFSINGFLEYATRDTGYNGTGDVNRLTGITAISNSIFDNDLEKIMLGIGIGNAEYTNFFVSDFYTMYSYLNYQWFHMIWTFIEAGLLGIIFYLSFFICTFIKASKIKKIDMNISTTRIMILIMLFLFVYNISLRVEPSGYLLYLILSIPYIYVKERKEKI